MTAPNAPADNDEDLPPLKVGLAQALAATIQDAVATAAQASPGMQASAKAKKLVAKRVPKSWLPKYSVMDDYSFVIWDETMTILDRILVYPYTTSYRKHLKDSPKEVLKAWQFHSHSLRVGELYIVLDRTIALLDFLTVVAKDCGIPVKNHSKSFENRFKDTFKRRLLERHRLTHAHERPSFVSRIIDLSGGKWEGDQAASIEQVLDILTKTLSEIIKVNEAAGHTLPQSLEEVEALHELGAQREARCMLKLVSEALLGTINYQSPMIKS